MEERKEKGDADKRTTTMLVALLEGASALRLYIHPWWRHLPAQVQAAQLVSCLLAWGEAILQELKGPLQRSHLEGVGGHLYIGRLPPNGYGYGYGDMDEWRFSMMVFYSFQ